MAKTTPVGISTGVLLLGNLFGGSQRSRALDAWDYRAPFARFHIRWGEGDVTPAFGLDQAFGIALQELHLEQAMELWAHREVLVTFSSEHIQVGSGPAEREPAWVVILAGIKREGPAPTGDLLAQIRPGGGVILQVLIHARTGELLLGTALPVALRRG